jgi:hypothetical protein
MKNQFSRLLLTLTTLGTLALTGYVFAQEQAPTTPPPEYDKVIVKEGQTYGIAGGQETALTNMVKLTPTITVNTNGTFKVGEQGADRTLKQGQVLGKDGRLTDTDGSLVPVEDHVTKRGNQLMLVKEGVASPLTSPLTLGDGSVVGPDGYLVKGGRRQFIVEGQIIQLSGEKLASVDTATIVNGQVTVQLNGQSIQVAPNRSITMNDGTRVFGDGRVVKFRGGETRLKEGEVMRIEGVATK